MTAIQPQTEPAQRLTCNQTTNWDAQPWGRSRARPDSTAARSTSKPVLFSRALVPAANHPLIVARGEDFVRDLLAHRFYVYADFTAWLERDAINVVANELARGVFWSELPAKMREFASCIYTDEAYHAQQSEEIVQALQTETNVRAIYLQEPQFLRILRQVCKRRNDRVRRLLMVCFAIVSETLITAILSDIPKDVTVDGRIRDYVREHAKDEGRHHAFFAELLRYGWPRLPKRDQNLLGPHFATFTRAFLDPDLEWLPRFLGDNGFRAEAVDQIIEDCYPQAGAGQRLRASARHSLALFQEVGVFQNARTRQAFV